MIKIAENNKSHNKISNKNILEAVLKDQKVINGQIKATEQELAAIDAKRAALQDTLEKDSTSNDLIHCF